MAGLIPAGRISAVFWVLGELLAQLRWGLPEDTAVCDDPWLHALLSQYSATLARLRRSFVGPDPLEPVTPLGPEAFAMAYRTGTGDEWVEAFLATQERSRRAAGLDGPPDGNVGAAYGRYVEFVALARERDVVLDRIAGRLGYDTPSVQPTTVPTS